MLIRKYLILFASILFCACLSSETASDKTATPVDERPAKLSAAKESIAPFFESMNVREGDWLESFQESGQTFEDYLAGNPTLPTASRHTIYIQPIGDFTESQRKILYLTADYMKAFYNLPVKLNPEKNLPKVPPELKRKNPSEGHIQIKTAYFLNDILPKLLPDDAAAFICFTNFDLCPDENWNYVFGQATFEHRVGVWSLKRFGNPEKSEREFKTFLARTLKVAMHETGHMFSIKHCTKYECLMSGTNHLAETDRRPLDVCPECMAKISWAMNYDPIKRYRNLSEFWRRQGWSEEEKLFTKKAQAMHNFLDNN
jgi:archaemetzincin